MCSVLSNCVQPSKIQEYAAIGDCRSVALVSNQGSIDWLCWPRFDSPSVFAALIDPNKGGSWKIAPTIPYQTERAYVGHSNVLQTHFTCADGRATLTDLMPVMSEEEKRESFTPDHELVRQLECTEGSIEIEVLFHPRSDYGAKSLRIQNLHPLGMKISAGDGSFWLRSNTPLAVKDDRAGSVVRIKRGEVLRFSFSYTEESPAVLPLLGKELDERIQRSVQWWEGWAERCTYAGPYRENVVRSALTLKLLAYAPSGAITASPTTSLPEVLGGDLNWDYRYCWLRDASLTVRSLLGLGYKEEAESFLNWLLHATRITQPKLRPLYDVYGNFIPHERLLHHLSGYCGSSPVRVGNDARNQLQLDVYGEVIDAAEKYIRAGGEFDRTTQKVLIGFGKEVARSWDVPDESIWEPRSGRQRRAYSRLLCWVSLDRLIELANEHLLQGVPLKSFVRERARIQEQIESRAWNHSLESYVSILDGGDLDASLLLMPWYGFEPADSSRMQKTYRRICTQLNAGNALLYRYSRDPTEGAFDVCGFWVAEYLALGGGTLEQARQQFESALRLQNDVGLFSEETDPATGDALGNFPQGFAHVGVISAALALQERAERDARQGGR